MIKMVGEGKLKKMGNSKKIGETTFTMHFMDNRHKKWTQELSKKIKKYETPLGTKCEIKIEHNPSAKIVSIYITIKYPNNQENINNLDELIELNEELFMNYYKREVGYI